MVIITQVRVAIFNERTQQPEEDVLEKLRGEPLIDKAALNCKYQEFQAEYNQNIKFALSSANGESNPARYLVRKAKDLVTEDAGSSSFGRAVRGVARAAVLPQPHAARTLAL